MTLAKVCLGFALIFGSASVFAAEGNGLRDDQMSCLQIDLTQETQDARYCSAVQQELQGLANGTLAGERCISDRDCSFTEVCASGRCVRKGPVGGGCRFDSDCGFGKRCVNKMCRDNSGPGSRCFSNLDCAPGFRCVNRTCVR